MITTLPFVAVVLLIKVGLQFGIQFEGVLEFSDVGLVLTGGVFLMGFMLAGTMADYKESEKLPGTLACSLENIEEFFDQATVGRPTLHRLPLKTEVRDAGRRIRQWIFKQTPSAEV